MNLSRSTSIVATALALFAMLFGSGNIAFPLGLGRDLGDVALYAMIVFFVTAVLVPVLGIVAMAYYNGDYRAFMQRIGEVPARIVIFLCFALIGPFCVIPRCIAFSHAALQWLVPQLNLFVFTLIAACVIFATTVRKSGVIPLMSRILGPLKIALLSAVIFKGLVSPSMVAPCTIPGWASFMQGILSGYGTLDLLAIIFTSGMLLSSLAYTADGKARTQREMISILVQAGLLGAFLLGIMYAGFVIVASMQSGMAACRGVEEGQLLSILASIVLGAGGGALASVTMAVACSTTAIALTSIFSEYVSTELNVKSFTYQHALVATIVIATVFANYGAAGIKAFLAPIVSILYPGLIVLACVNILAKARNIDLGATPFYLTVIGAAIAKYLGII